MARTVEEAFMEDIIAHPDDDAPRLIYADWLDDHGQEARAEFIRVQIERARWPKDTHFHHSCFALFSTSKHKILF